MAECWSSDLNWMESNSSQHFDLVYPQGVHRGVVFPHGFFFRDDAEEKVCRQPPFDASLDPISLGQVNPIQTRKEVLFVSEGDPLDPFIYGRHDFVKTSIDSQFVEAERTKDRVRQSARVVLSKVLENDGLLITRTGSQRRSPSPHAFPSSISLQTPSSIGDTSLSPSDSVEKDGDHLKGSALSLPMKRPRSSFNEAMTETPICPSLASSPGSRASPPLKAEAEPSKSHSHSSIGNRHKEISSTNHPHHARLTRSILSMSVTASDNATTHGKDEQSGKVVPSRNPFISSNSTEALSITPTPTPSMSGHTSTRASPTPSSLPTPTLLTQKSREKPPNPFLTSSSKTSSFDSNISSSSSTKPSLRLPQNRPTTTDTTTGLTTFRFPSASSSTLRPTSSTSSIPPTLSSTMNRPTNPSLKNQPAPQSQPKAPAGKPATSLDNVLDDLLG